MIGEMQNQARKTWWCKKRRGEWAWRLAAMLLLALVGSIGCDPITTIGFLAYPFCPNNEEAVFPLTIKGKESTIVIMCAHEEGGAVKEVFRNADQDLCKQLTNMLSARYKENKDKIKIVPVSSVYGYMREHKNWITQPKQDIAKHFNADFLVFLEIGPMSMYEPLSNETLYRGNVGIRIAVFDTHKPDGDGMKPEQFYSRPYPSTHPEDAGSMRPEAFRNRFLDQIAKDLVHYFATIPANDNFGQMSD